MAPLPLTFGPLEADGFQVGRSGLRWLCADGHVCRANEIVAYCNLALAGRDNSLLGEERFDLQVAFAPRLRGRIRRVAEASRGGYLDRLPSSRWTPDAVWAHLEDVQGEADGVPHEPRLLFLAGRRFTDIADNRSGLLTGWHDRTRAWWGEGDAATLLGAGTCEQDGILRGDVPYAAAFEQAVGPAQVAVFQDEPLVPCARTLIEQLQRTPEDLAAIREDFARSFPPSGQNATAGDWLFIGALLNALERAPLADSYDLLTREGLRRSNPAGAVSLSLTAELPQAARHKRLGYTLNCHGFRLRDVSPVVRAWMRENFEPFQRTPDQLAADYRALIAAAPGRRLFVVNRISTQLYEQIQTYASFDEAAMRSLGSVQAKEFNLVLHDLARDDALDIVDADAIAADLGMAHHLPDGVHASGTLYAEIRAELMRLVTARGFAGFSRS